jgi:hypothetical protein
MARDGLRAQLVVAELDDDTLSEVRQIAIRDAVIDLLADALAACRSGDRDQAAEPAARAGRAGGVHSG